MTRVGIVGHEAAKFGPETRQAAIEHIRNILATHMLEGVTRAVSGHCHLGGIDIWCEKVAKELACYDKDLIFPPKDKSWATGYKPRNILIAENSDIVYVIVVKELPAAYAGMKFKLCYHCGTTSHVKSGGCWTAIHAQKIGKRAIWIEI